MYNAALKKETVEDNGDTHLKINFKASTKQLGDQLQHVALADFDWLCTLPSIKWTWGPDLTLEDGLKLITDPLPLVS